MLTHHLPQTLTPTDLPEVDPPDGAGGWNHAALSYAREVVPLIDTIVEAMASQGYSQKDQFGMRLALEEAIVNALRHGNRSDPNKQVHVRYSVLPDRALAEVEDEGPGFDPHRLPDPTDQENLERLSGRGLLLIEHYTSWAHYNKRGNQVILCRYPSATARG
jgi:serine/threonine-protein kinase RsbW